MGETAAVMHPDQIFVDAGQVAALVEHQFPQWAALPVTAVRSHGTVNALFRIGGDLVGRFPIVAGDVDQTRRWLAADAEAARWLLGRVPVATPEPVVVGEPGEDYPLPWAVYRWLPGTTADRAGVAQDPVFARDVAGVVLALRTLDTQGRRFEGTHRGGLLPSQDDYVTTCIARSEGMIDCRALTRLWAELREAPRDDAPDLWTHGDLMPGNMLVTGGRLSAVIDVGGLMPADPALDLQPAWNLMDPASRRVFRQTLRSSDAEWDRGRGWAFAQAIGCLHYYAVTNPVMSLTARRTLQALLDDTSTAPDRGPA